MKKPDSNDTAAQALALRLEDGKVENKLTFPTMAQQAVAEFRTATKTTALATIARRRGAEVEQKWDRTIYTFDDDTSIEVRGRGRSHRIEVLLP